MVCQPMAWVYILEALEQFDLALVNEMNQKICMTVV